MSDISVSSRSVYLDIDGLQAAASRVRYPPRQVRSGVDALEPEQEPCLLEAFSKGAIGWARIQLKERDDGFGTRNASLTLTRAQRLSSE